MRISGRSIARGHGKGEILVSHEPISFLSGVDPDTGTIIEKGNPLEGRSITGTVFVFPEGKGSTVGSYILYALGKNGHGPAAIINRDTEPIVAVGAIIGGIPLVDRPDVPFSAFKNGVIAEVNGDTGEIILFL